MSTYWNIGPETVLRQRVRNPQADGLGERVIGIHGVRQDAVGKGPGDRAALWRRRDCPRRFLKSVIYAKAGSLIALDRRRQAVGVDAAIGLRIVSAAIGLCGRHARRQRHVSRRAYGYARHIPLDGSRDRIIDSLVGRIRRVKHQVAPAAIRK